MVRVGFHELGKVKQKKLVYVVICAQHNADWVVVRHKERKTWEIPGGHIEKNESPDDAAVRELHEETGAHEVKLAPVCDYSVEREDEPTFGRLYYATVHLFKDIPESEIAERMFVPELPRELTYPQIQPLLHAKAVAWLSRTKPAMRMVAEF